ncbi:multidrug export protein MepA [Clostridiales bacterium]|nr:multidrug export protein MepA [Lachnospiraceae bacterium]GFI61871.1 multidrug export protein MepA [Clostridiales bacterium]
MEVQTENKMGTMPINKLLVNISLPMVVSMLVQALYNIVDSVFVAQIDEYALTAVSLAFPLQNFMIAVAAGTGVGVNALLSKRLGEQRLDEANLAAGNSVFLAGCNYLLFLLIGIGFSDFYFRVQTDIPEIIAYGKIYMFICTACSFGLFGQFCFERLLQATGRTVCTMITQTTGAVLNLIFDPILIFGWFGFPKMGIAGAAAATVFGQIAAMFFGFYYNQKKNKEIRLSVSAIRPQKATLQQIYAVAVPAILMQSIGSVMTFFMNKILLGFTSTAAAVFGVYFKLQSFIFMPVFGMNNGLIPIVAYNFGAGYRERIVKVMKSSMAAAVVIMLAGLITAELIPEQLLLLFNASEQMLTIGVFALRVLSLCYIFAGVSIVASGLFQGLGKSVYSLVLSVIRQLVILIPAAYLLSLTGRLEAVWFSFPLAEIASLLVTLLYLKKTMRNLDEMIAHRT